VTAPSPAFERLRALLAEIHDLHRTMWLMAWDQETMMPPGGAEARAEQRATVGRLAHERIASPELGALLDELRPLEETLDYDSFEAALVRVARRDHEKAARVPVELQEELTRAGSLGFAAWLEARRRRDFEVLRPHIERQLELKRRYIECFPHDDPYDVLLDDYEEGARTAEVERTFDELRPELVALARAASAVDDSCLHGSFDLDRQRAFVLDLLRRLGYREDSWRLDGAEHPFTSALGTGDVRITTHLHEEHLGGVFAAIHEFGHGLYEHQVDPSLVRTPLATGASSILHESQSRMWENVVGRSRPFWSHFYPQLRRALPQFEDVPLETFLRAINRVQPSLIRVDADEVTYNLHIVLRFELERDLLAGRLATRDLPEAFDARMEECLGLRPPDVLGGVLQDMHWSDGGFGYFPTYALGNVVSLQIWERARADLPTLEEEIERGEFGPLREWLREHLHRHGRSFPPSELLERAAGGPLDAGPYLRYLRGKLAELAESRG
jgi:carboxypeptidase Taq